MSTPIIEESLLNALLENLSDSIYFKDSDSKIILCNQKQAEMMGASSVEEVIGKTDADFFGPQHARKTRLDEVALMQGKKIVDNQLERADFPDGTVMWHLTSKATLKDNSGDVIGTMGISKDMTELKETQDRLLKAQQKISEDSRNAGRAEIASIVIHNVGNMLNSVNITASMIDQLSKQHDELDLDSLSSSVENQLENPTMDPRDFLSKVGQYLKIASEKSKQEQEHFRTEIDNLKQDVSRIQRVILVQQELVNHLSEGQYRCWVDVVEDALEINKVALARHQVTCIRDFKAPRDIDIPEFQVLQILLNFISNSKYAFDHISDRSKKMSICVDIRDDDLLLIVEDNGIGIEQKDLDQIFELGFTTRETGHGIGLHGSRMAAREINSKIVAKSLGHNKGAIFTLAIPLSECRRTT